MHLRNSFLLSCALLVNCFSFTTPLMNRESIAELLPINPIFEEGDTIVLTCVLSPLYNGTLNSSNLAFKHMATLIGSEFYHILNSTAVELRLPLATFNHYGHFSCVSKIDNRYLGVRASQDVNVVRHPLKSKIEECYVRNWKSLFCWWTPSRTEQNAHINDLFINSSSKRDLFNTTIIWHDMNYESVDCRQNSTTGSFELRENTNVSSSCRFQMGRSYCLKVRTYNILQRYSESDAVCLNTSDIVWPDPVENFNYSFSPNGLSLVVAWKTPSSSFQFPHDPSSQLIYELIYKDDVDQVNVSIGNINTTSVTLQSKPYRVYTIWLRTRPLYSGFWSNLTGLISSHSPATVPCQQPSVHPRGFTVLSPSKNRRTVVVYWKQISPGQFCGPNGGYEVSQKSDVGHWTPNGKIKTSNTAELDVGLHELDVSVRAVNDEGIATEPYELIHVPARVSGEHKSVVDDVVVELSAANSSFAEIHWSYNVELNVVTAVSLFWCVTLPHSISILCENGIEWMELNKTQTSYLLDTSHIRDRKGLRAGISVEAEGISNGITWSSVTYEVDKLAPCPQITGAILQSGSGNSLQVTWKKPNCVTSPCGYANSYILFYCVADGNDTCSEAARSVVIPAGQVPYTLTGLKHESTYKLWMQSNSKAGLSDDSNTIIASTTKNWKSAGSIVGIAFGALTIIPVILCGIYGIFRCCNKYKKKITRGVEITIPRSVPAPKILKTSTSSETQILYNSYNSGYSRQGSDMSHDSGRFSLTQPCTTYATTMVMQQLSPLVSKSNGVLPASTVTPLIGIQEDGLTDDVFPEVTGFDGNGYVKTTIIDDHDDSTGYKVLCTAGSVRADDGSNDPNSRLREMQLKVPAMRGDGAAPSVCAPYLRGLDNWPAGTILSTANDPENSAYIRIMPGALPPEDNVLCYQPQSPAEELVPVFVPPVADFSYTTVEMLNPSLIIPARVGPGGGVCGDANALENGYTDLSFLTSVGASDIVSQRDSNCNFPSSEVKPNHPSRSDKIPRQEDLGNKGVQTLNLARPVITENSEFSENKDRDLILSDPVRDCISNGISIDSNYAPRNLDWINGPSVFSAKGDEQGNCCVVPSGAVTCDNGYVRHNDFFNSVL